MDVKVGRTAVYISVFVGMRLAELYGLNIQVAGRQAGDRQKWRIRARPASIICLPRLVAFSVCRERQKPRPQKKHPRQSRKYGRKSGGGDGAASAAAPVYLWESDYPKKKFCCSRQTDRPSSISSGYLPSWRR